MLAGDRQVGGGPVIGFLGLGFPYNLLALVGFVAMVFGAGAVVGVNYQQGHEASSHLVEATKFIERNKKIVAADNKGMAVLSAHNAQLEAENERLQAEARTHAANIPDPVA